MAGSLRHRDAVAMWRGRAGLSTSATVVARLRKHRAAVLRQRMERIAAAQSGKSRSNANRSARKSPQ